MSSGMLSLIICASVAAPVNFDTEIMPLLTKAGCNAAACHGAASGRGGFKLSLFGGNPAADFAAIARDREGRRVNLARPAASLLLTKPTMTVDHEGGLRFGDDSAPAKLLTEWIGEGARRTRSQQAVAVRVDPATQTVFSDEPVGKLRVIAVFRDADEPADATTIEQDVTSWAVFTPDDDSAVSVADDGRVHVTRPGQHTVVVRFLQHVVAARVLMPFALRPMQEGESEDEEKGEEKAEDSAGASDSQVGEDSTGASDSQVGGDSEGASVSRRIDREVADLLATLRIPVSPPANDASLLRRVALDLTGRLPSEEEVRSYLADTSPDKYTRLVDRLLGSEALTDYWTYRLGGWLRLRAPGGDSLAADAMHRWLRQQIEADAGLDSIARRMVTATGDTHLNGPAVFHRLAGDPREAAELASETLLGIRLRCANCHDHPLDRWTQDDYHGLAALFARIERGRVVRRLDRGDVIHPVTQEPALPRTPGGEPLDIDAAGPEQFAAWIVDSDNPYFAKTQVNRIWQAMMGRGLIEPVDDVRDTNPPTHPRLLDSLAEDFRRNGYRLRPLLRALALSETYRRSSRPYRGNGFDDRFYSHGLEKPMPAEIYLDAVSDVTGIRESFDTTVEGARAVQLASPNVASMALDILGRCSRDQSCETGSSAGGGMAAQLHLLNGELINRRLLDEQGWLHTQLERNLPAVVEATYLRCFGRMPSDRERVFWVSELADADGRRPSPEKLADFFWSVLVSREFAMNH